jgi:hypothetical protein
MVTLPCQGGRQVLLGPLAGPSGDSCTAVGRLSHLGCLSTGEITPAAITDLTTGETQRRSVAGG